MKISVSCADVSNAMLSHEHGRVRIVKDIARQMRQAPKYLGRNICMALSRNQKLQSI